MRRRDRDEEKEREREREREREKACFRVLSDRAESAFASCKRVIDSSSAAEKGFF